MTSEPASRPRSKTGRDLITVGMRSLDPGPLAMEQVGEAKKGMMWKQRSSHVAIDLCLQRSSFKKVSFPASERPFGANATGNPAPGAVRL